MSLGNIGKNSANEFFETIIYMTAYNEARDKIQEYTSGIENPILREAAESAANVAAFGGIFMIIRYEEAILEKAFAVASGLVAILMGVGKKAVDKLKNATFRGKKLAILSKILGRDTAAELNVEDLNKIGSFMFVQDDTGKITGLTEQFFSLVNGLGYLHNKG